MIFSATVPSYIQEIARNYMRSPILLDLVGKNTEQMPDTISNELVLCKDFASKQFFIRKFIMANRHLKILIFCETKIEVRNYERQKYAKFGCLQGDLEQNARLRILREYREPDSRMILVATDVAARGLDIDDIDVVIQQSVRNTDAFIHRTGRTGRAGKSGRNIVLLNVNEDVKGIDFFKKIEQTLKCKFQVSNAIMNVSSADSHEAEKIEVDKITNKVKHQAASNQLESRQLSDQAEARIDELMDWFVDLDAVEQQTFIRNMISEKFGRSSLKTEESIGLLSMKE